MQENRLRVFVYSAVFVLVLALAMTGMWQATLGTALADAEGGDVPPGGTIPAPNPPGKYHGSISVVHWAPFDANRDNTAVDVRTETDELVDAEFSGLKYQDSSQFIVLPSREYDWKVTLVSDPSQTVVDLPPFTLNSGAVLTIMLLWDDDAGEVTSLLFVHVLGSPVPYFVPLLTAQGEDE